MNDEVNYKNNPLHGLSLKNLLIELVDYYGFEILFAYLNINCFKTNPSIESSVKFLKKTDWAREKVESFYLYQFKNLPNASSEQFSVPPRDRIVPEGHTPGEPAELSFEDAERLREKQAKKAAAYRSSSASGKKYGGQRSGGYASSRGGERSHPKPASSPNSNDGGRVDPWANSRK
ncbi:VF530 family DNA-binding protein [Alkalimarinus alittae]|uniref:VF530 family DNA-binding protein n=1 Tax=Alkalimarinus alittae TaxID=2961619 RepID=A0ABY6MY77_9ALTE|nr:VF530 family DNA-binding protein [Alkalimarinus alittae]